MNFQLLNNFEAIQEDKNLSAEWQKMEEAFPYFVIPKLLQSQIKYGKIDAKTVVQFNLNKTLIDIHFHQKKKNIEEQETVAPIVEQKSEQEHNTAEIETGKTNANLSNPSSKKDEVDALIEPISSQDYYQSKGIPVSHELPSKSELQSLQQNTNNEDEEQSLLVQMSFVDWLKMITESKRKEREEQEEQDALKLKWRQQKLAEAIQEENDEIPEQVFKMAVESIEKEESLVSESLAEIYRIQGKPEKAISVYRKLILLNPEKKVYFADKIEQINKSL